MVDFELDASWTLFLDRDGVINKRNFEGYITSVEAFEFLPETISGLKKLSKQFSKIIVVTNQQGIGKGIMTTTTLNKIHNHMCSVLKEEGIKVDKVYFADNLRDANNNRRKPNPAMALEAQEDFPTINFKKSLMVGDTDSDLRFGTNLGMKTVLIASTEKTSIEPDIKVKNLKELADELEK